MTRASLLVIVLLSLGCAASAVRAADDLTANFEKFAQRISVFGADDFMHGFRPRRWGKKDNREALRDFSAFLKEKPIPAAQLAPLLKHDSAKVRTLAAVALYDLEDPKLLPLLLPLIDDKAATFPERMPVANAIGENDNEPTNPRTVADDVLAIFRTYLEAAGYYYGMAGVEHYPGFDDYWKQRSQRPYCASWFAVKLMRAGYSTSPTPADRHDAIRKLRAEIDRVPQPDRTWILLWLNGESGSDVLETDEELVAMLRELGHDALLKTLRNALPSDDPDLKPRRSNNYPHHLMRLFILKHAAELLKPEDAPELLALEQEERDSTAKRGNSDPLVQPAWAIAAATLKPMEAHEILSAAHARFTGEYQGEFRLMLAETLWDLNGEPDVATVIDWFYAELPHPPQSTWGLSNFLTTIAQKKRDSRPFMAALIKDPRFEQLNWKSVEAVAKIVKTYGLGEVVAAQALSDAWSPTGVDFFYKNTDAEMKQYPKETQIMLDRLAAWRAAIKASVPKWPAAK